MTCYTFIIRATLALFVLCTITTATSLGGLMLTVTDAGGGETRWQFSGSDVITAVGFSPSASGMYIRGPYNAGSPVAVSLNDFSANSGTGSMTLNGVTEAGSGVLSVTSSGMVLGMVAADLGFTPAVGPVSWEGDMIVSIPFSNLVPGTYTSPNLAFDTTLQSPATVTVAVPEPSAFFYLGLVGLFAGYRRWRR